MSRESLISEFSRLRSFLSHWCDDADRVGEKHDRIRLVEELLGKEVCRRLGIYPLPPGFLLSVAIPVFNEHDTVEEVIRRVRGSGVPCEIVLVDDGSTDGTRELLERHGGEPDITVLVHGTNRGKGAALKTAFAHVRGDVVIVQDADLEYDPSDYLNLMQPIVEDEADVVFGSRFRGDRQPVIRFWHFLGNRLLTLLSNASTNLSLSDIETGYKVFRRDVIQKIGPTLKEQRFGIEPELAAKVARLPGVRVVERAIRYRGRSRAEGKKIGWRDGLRALWAILRY